MVHPQQSTLEGEDGQHVQATRREVGWHVQLPPPQDCGRAVDGLVARLNDRPRLARQEQLVASSITCLRHGLACRYGDPSSFGTPVQAPSVPNAVPVDLH